MGHCESAFFLHFLANLIYFFDLVQKLHSHTVSRCPLWYLRYLKQRKNKKQWNNQYKNQKNQKQTTKKIRDSSRRSRRLGDSRIFFWFLAYHKPSTLLIWKHSAPSSKTYMLNSESISETFHLQAALRDTVVTGSSRKKTGPWKAAARIEKMCLCIYEIRKL